MSKRGFAVMFDWMFSIVAGVLIFSFLIYFAVQNTDLFGKVTARVVSEELDILFSGYETTQTKSVLDFDKNVKLDFSCDKINKRQRFMINDREGKNLWGKIIFSPKSVESDKINVATASWNVPFRVANFVYIWDKKYNLLGDVPSVDVFSDRNLKNSDGEKVNFIKSVNENFKCIYASVKTIYYDVNDGYYRGYICFKGKDDDPTKFFGEAMMIGAILSEDKKDFDCVKSIAINRLKLVNEVYEKKAGKMITSFETCDSEGNYNRAYHKLTDIDSFDSKFYSSDVISLVKSNNDRLIRGGCAGVF